MAAECNREFQHVFERLLATVQGDAIEVAFRIGVSEIERGRSEAVTKRKNRDRQLDTPRCVYQMTKHRLVRAHTN